MPDFLFTLILLGSIQGVIICGLLLFSKGRLLPNRLLTAIIGVISLPGFHLYFHYKDVYEINGLTKFIHDIMPMVVFMPLGPLIYFYVRSLINPGLQLNKKALLHFLPVIIDLVPKIAGLVLHISFWLGYPISSRGDYRALDDLYNHYADIPRWISMTVYLILAIRYLQTHRNKIHPASQKVNNWLRLFTGLFAGFQIIWVVYLIPYIIPEYSDQLLKAVNWFPIYIPMTILVYWVGIQGYLTSLKLTIPKKLNRGDWVQEAWQRLSNSMESDHLYLDPELNVGKVAEHTGLSTRQISELLNQYRFTNFNAFINQYRVEEFKSRLVSPTSNQFTMAGLAMECGFNSPATFNRIFKQYTGMVPSAFLKASGKTMETAPNRLKSA